MNDQNGLAECDGFVDAEITEVGEQNTASSSLLHKSNLFAGISIFVNGLTNPSSDELKHIMMEHGGTFHHDERSHTTYIIVSDLPDFKVENMDTSKIISAKCVVDCLVANRILDYTQYLLHTNQKTTEKTVPTFFNMSRSEKVVKVLKDMGKLNGITHKSVIEKHNNKTDATINMELKKPNTVPNTINTMYTGSIDKRPLTFDQIRKSVSAEVNDGICFKETAELDKFLRELCEEVHSRLCQIKRKTKCVTIKVMVLAKDASVETSKFMGHGVCDYITKSVSLTDFTNDIEVITRSVLNTIKNLNMPPNDLRGIGIQLTELDEPKQTEREPKENIKDMIVKSEKRKESRYCS